MCEIFWSVIPQMNLVSLHLPYFLHITCFLEDLAFSVDGMVQKECCPAGLERSDIITYLHFSLGQQVVQLALISNGFLFNTVHSSFEKLQRLPKKWWIVMNSMTEVGPGDWPTHEPIIWQYSLASGWNGQIAFFFGILWSSPNDEWTVLKYLSCSSTSSQ